MGSIYLRKYGASTTINFCLYELDGTDLQAGAAHAAGDTKIMKDEGAEANTGSAFVDEGQGYSLALSAAEMTAARVAIYVVDQTSPKAWLDRVLIIETYGHTSGQHAFDLASATVNLSAASEAQIDAIEMDTNEIQGKLPTNKIMGSSVVTDKDDEIDAIKAKTDLIPADITTQLDTNVPAIKAKTDLIPADIVTQLDTNVPAIKAKTDNLPADPADESLLESEINANETKIDAIDAVVDAIKLKTDNLPSDPADASVIDADLTSIESKIDTIDDFLDTEVAAILADTNELQTDWVNGGRLDLLLDSVITKVDAVDDYVDTEVAAIKAVTDTLSLATIADAIHDEVTETGITLRKAINIMLAALAGKSSGGGTATIKFRDQADGKDRITATVDADGNRTAITNDGT